MGIPKNDSLLRIPIKEMPWYHKLWAKPLHLCIKGLILIVDKFNTFMTNFHD
jgi:hypothetical protein